MFRRRTAPTIPFNLVDRVIALGVKPAPDHDDDPRYQLCHPDDGRCVYRFTLNLEILRNMGEHHAAEVLGAKATEITLSGTERHALGAGCQLALTAELAVFVGNLMPPGWTNLRVELVQGIPPTHPQG